MTDTLGWVYFKKDLTGMAIPLFQQCIQADPQNPIYRFHLGLVHAKRGEDAKARVFLEAALKISKNFPGADEARKVLSRLMY